MARLHALNTACCPQCRSKETRRVGYAKDKQGSVWVCRCLHAFTVPLLVVSPAPRG